MQHDLFVSVVEAQENGDEGFPWIQGEQNLHAMPKLTEIFLERTCSLFSAEDTLLYLKEVIGGLLNILDDGTGCERDLVLAKIVSICQIPFDLSRYKSLLVHDFSDKLTTVDMNELFGPNAAQH